MWMNQQRRTAHREVESYPSALLPANRSREPAANPDAKILVCLDDDKDGTRCTVLGGLHDQRQRCSRWAAGKRGPGEYHLGRDCRRGLGPTRSIRL